MRHDIEFNFRGLQIAGHVCRGYDQTREDPGLERHVEDFDIIGIVDSRELRGWVEVGAGALIMISNDRLPADVKAWIEVNWNEAIFEAANEEINAE